MVSLVHFDPCIVSVISIVELLVSLVCCLSVLLTTCLWAATVPFSALACYTSFGQVITSLARAFKLLK